MQTLRRKRPPPPPPTPPQRSVQELVLAAAVAQARDSAAAVLDQGDLVRALVRGETSVDEVLAALRDELWSQLPEECLPAPIPDLGGARRRRFSRSSTAPSPGRRRLAAAGNPRPEEAGWERCAEECEVPAATRQLDAEPDLDGSDSGCFVMGQF